MEENLITVDVLSSADQEDLANELGFTARKCHAVISTLASQSILDHAGAPDASSSEASKGERESGHDEGAGKQRCVSRRRDGKQHGRGGAAEQRTWTHMQAMHGRQSLRDGRRSTAIFCKPSFSRM